MDKDDYVNEIKKGLQDLPDSDEWMEELESHIGQAFAHYLNEGKTEKEAMMRIWHEVGSPAGLLFRQAPSCLIFFTYLHRNTTYREESN
jgi:uncharacterized membrane protein